MATTTQPISPSSTRQADAIIVAPSPAAHTPSRLDNRWMRAVVPALLIHISIGTVYCWSVFKQLIADQMHVAPSTIEWGFSLAIFFLGMSAAFLGPVVEKDIRRSALIGLVCFVAGFVERVQYRRRLASGVFICYGAIWASVWASDITPVRTSCCGSPTTKASPRASRSRLRPRQSDRQPGDDLAHPPSVL